MDNTLKEKTITIVLGSYLSMYGVKDIRAFDEGYVSLDTLSGKVSVEGSGLKIESLSKEDGAIFIKGDISGVFCEADAAKEKGFIKRLFGRK